jgi:hypothetical protein
MKLRTILPVFGLFLSLALVARAQTYDTNNIEVQTFAGSGFYGYYDGTGVRTMFSNPRYITADSNGNLFVLDDGNKLIRKITPAGVVSTFYILPNLYQCVGISFDKSSTPQLLVCFSSGFLRIGNESVSYIDPAPPVEVSGFCVDSMNRIYISSAPVNRIYRLDGNRWELFAGSGNPDTVDGNWIFSSFYYPTQLVAGKNDSIYCFEYSGAIRKITQNLDVTTVVSGINEWPRNPVDGTGTMVRFPSVNGVCVDTNDVLYLACGTYVRKLTPNVVATTLAGSFTEALYVDGAGSAARFRNAAGICLSQGKLFVTDYDDHRIRKITFSDVFSQVVKLQASLYPGIQITGANGRSCRVESSTNLVDWKTETTVAVTNASQLWVDPVPAVGAVKTYRAFILP